MKLLKNKYQIIFAISVFFLSTNCNKTEEKENYQQYLEITEQQWTAALKNLGFEHDDLSNTVLLVTGSTHCSDCLEELSFWNDLFTKENNSFNLYLVVIERYESRYINFLERNNLDIRSFQDQSASIPQSQLIPFIPVKMYFDRVGNIRRLHSIGSDDSLNDFLSEFTSTETSID